MQSLASQHPGHHWESTNRGFESTCLQLCINMINHDSTCKLVPLICQTCLQVVFHHSPRRCSQDSFFNSKNRFDFVASNKGFRGNVSVKVSVFFAKCSEVKVKVNRNINSKFKYRYLKKTTKYTTAQYVDKKKTLCESRCGRLQYVTDYRFFQKCVLVQWEPLNLPEQNNKTVAFHRHADDWPTAKYQSHSPQEEGRTPELVSLEEEVSGPPKADDERQPGQKQDLRCTGETWNIS